MMLVFHIAHYKITFDPAYGIEVLNHMWATEPVGTLSIIVAIVGIVLGMSYKLLDLWWDLHKERARQGRLRIELLAARTSDDQPALRAVVSNTGREPVVIREIGYRRFRLLGKEFVAVDPAVSPLPHALNAHNLVEIKVPADEVDLNTLLDSFCVKDSLGKLWDAPDGEIRKAKRQLRGLQASAAGKARRKPPPAEKLQVVVAPVEKP